MNLRWQTSELAGALYAADLVRRGVRFERVEGGFQVRQRLPRGG